MRYSPKKEKSLRSNEVVQKSPCCISCNFATLKCGDSEISALNTQRFTLPGIHILIGEYRCKIATEEKNILAVKSENWVIPIYEKRKKYLKLLSL